MNKGLTLVLAGVTSMGLAFSAFADNYITLASTTSTQNSGLFNAILPQFEDTTGIDVRVVAVGTGQAFEIARRGDADSLLVHDTAGEKRFVENGFATERADVMYNDFVLIGPADDPANIGEAQSAAEAFAAIANAKAPFTSRGDDSGTNRAELGERRRGPRRRLVPRTRQWHGANPQHRRSHGRVRDVGPRHLGGVWQPPEPEAAFCRRRSIVQPVR